VINRTLTTIRVLYRAESRRLISRLKNCRDTLID